MALVSMSPTSSLRACAASSALLPVSVRQRNHENSNFAPQKGDAMNLQQSDREKRRNDERSEPTASWSARRLRTPRKRGMSLLPCRAQT